jgi:hypothetical protein
MPDEKKPFLDRLTPEGQELTPVGYRFFDTPSLAITERMRTAPSDWYHAAGFACFSFYKPVSRCRRHDEP